MGHRALEALIAQYKNIDGMGYDTFMKYNESTVCPVTDYAAEIWSGLTRNNLDNVQCKAMRVFMGVHKFTPILPMVGDMGWYPSKNTTQYCCPSILE